MSLESNMKRCTDCDEPLPLDAFPSSAASKDGRRACCIECVRKRNSRAGGGDGELGAPSPVSSKQKAYRGVTGGPLLSGYVK